MTTCLHYSEIIHAKLYFLECWSTGHIAHAQAECFYQTAEKAQMSRVLLESVLLCFRGIRRIEISGLIWAPARAARPCSPHKHAYTRHTKKILHLLKDCAIFVRPLVSGQTRYHCPFAHAQILLSSLRNWKRWNLGRNVYTVSFGAHSLLLEIFEQSTKI